jgi:hypothetical protein
MYPFMPGESLLNTAEFVFALLALLSALVSSLWLARA